MRRPFPRSAILRALLSAAIVVVGLGAIAGAALLLLTQTEWGHERVRRFVLSQLEGRVAGRVRIGAVSGNLLREITLQDVSITDSAGAPFLAAEEITTRVTLRPLLRKELHLYGIRLLRPVVVLDKPPGPDGKWNYRRLCPGDSTKQPSGKPGFGKNVRLTQVRVIEGRFTVRSPWRPSDEKPRAEQQEDVREALAGETRIWVVRHPQGFQKVSDFRAISGYFPLMRLADPQNRPRRVEVAALSMEAQPFRPPVAEVLDVVGAFELNGDSAWWSGIRARLPGSFVSAAGRYNWKTDDFRLRLRGDPMTFTDFRWVYTRFPSNGAGALDFALDWTERPDGTEVERYFASNVNARVGRATLAGNMGIEFTKRRLESDWRFFDTNVRFANLETRLVEATLPFMEFPRHGTISGRGGVSGTQEALRLANFDITGVDRQYG